jgi:Tfp pilus assembly protein PilF
MTKPARLQLRSSALRYPICIFAFTSAPRRMMCLSLLLIAHLAATPVGSAQGKYTLFGDLKVDESKVDGQLPLSFNVILYSQSGTVIGRQSVPSGGRYRFIGLRGGEYDIVLEVDTKEVARIRVIIGSSIDAEHRQDLELEWRATTAGTKPKPQTVSASDLYQRDDANQQLFSKAQSTMVKKKYAEATVLLQQVLAADPVDFQAWTELGTAFFLQDKISDAEKSYRRALDVKETFAPAWLNLGRVLIAQKRFADAIDPLAQAVVLRRDSADALFLLGETYLQLKKGSKAVPFLNEAARLGQADAHLRLATLYNAAGLKNEAAAEYEQFLKKRPEHPERVKLERYIAEQKKP